MPVQDKIKENYDLYWNNNISSRIKKKNAPLKDIVTATRGSEDDIKRGRKLHASVMTYIDSLHAELSMHKSRIQALE